MKILMLGWEYPPRISGGLGVASQGLARELSRQGHEVTFVLPRLFPNQKDDKIQILDASKIDFQVETYPESSLERIQFLGLGVQLLPYLNSKIFKEETTKKDLSRDENEMLDKIKLTGSYGSNLQNELKKYALIVSKIISDKDFDIIHGHDWMTLPAARAASGISGVPFVAHIHSTEIDRNGTFASRDIFKIEKENFKAATHILAVSGRLKKTLIRDYDIEADRITVVPNGIGHIRVGVKKEKPKKKIGFVGRFAHQKGPVKFLEIARNLLDKRSDCEFVMVGDGHLMDSVRESIENLNLSSHLHLTGFLETKETYKLMNTLDVLLVPSVSEPFGLVALEAALLHVPVVISSGSGVSEFVRGMAEAQYWDTHTFTNRVEHVLDNKSAREKSVLHAFEDAHKLTWKKSVQGTLKVYNSLLV